MLIISPGDILIYILCCLIGVLADTIKELLLKKPRFTALAVLNKISLLQVSIGVAIGLGFLMPKEASEPSLPWWKNAILSLNLAKNHPYFTIIYGGLFVFLGCVVFWINKTWKSALWLLFFIAGLSLVISAVPYLLQ